VISSGQIVAASLLTALGVVFAAWAVHWPRAQLLLAAAGTVALILAWRAISNKFGLNGDFLPAISVGDTGCLVAGALVPLAMAGLGSVPVPHRWAPVVVGGVVGFLVNVVIL
jgi:hypothetical protein